MPRTCVGRMASDILRRIEVLPSVYPLSFQTDVQCWQNGKAFLLLAYFGHLWCELLNPRTPRQHLCMRTLGCGLSSLTQPS